MDPITRVKEFLNNYDVEVLELEANTHTAPLAAQALEVSVGEIAKTLAFVGKNKSVIIVTSGDTRIDNKALKGLTGEKMRMASPKEATALTGFPPGGVCPFDLPGQIPVYIDLSMERFPIVYAAAGTANSAVPVSVQQLLDITGGKTCQVSLIP